MSALVSIGAAVAKEVIPGLFKRAAGDKATRIAEGLADVVKATADISDDATPEQAVEAVKRNPAAYARVREAAASLAIAELEAETEAARIAMQDRASARQMYAKSDDDTTRLLVWFAAVYALLVAATVAGLIAMQIQITSLMGGLLGFFVRDAGGHLEKVYNFFLGSSSGSKKKTDMMGRPSE